MPRGHHVGPPPHVMSPTSFMHYLKQPGVLLTPLGPMGTEAVMADNFNGNMQDMRGMPDILQQQQHQSQGQGQGSAGKKHVNSELRLFKCLTCGKDFKQKSTLLQHERIHTDSRPYGCTECGKRFRQQSHLTQHLRIHANEKPFACVYCERTFRQRAILNQHLRIHSGEKPFQCPECGKRFRQKAILNQHVRTHQGEHFPLPPSTSHDSDDSAPVDLSLSLSPYSLLALSLRPYEPCTDRSRSGRSTNHPSPGLCGYAYTPGAADSDSDGGSDDEPQDLSVDVVSHGIDGNDEEVAGERTRSRPRPRLSHP